MVDITEISAIVVALGVAVGVVYYVLDIRHQRTMKQTDLVVRLSTYTTSRGFLKAAMEVHEAEFADYDDFVRKYGKPMSTKQIPMAFTMVGNFCEVLGVLYRNKLIDISLIDQLFGVRGIWEIMRPIVEGMRKEGHDPTIFEWFENLYNELRKREQKLHQSKA